MIRQQRHELPGTDLVRHYEIRLVNDSHALHRERREHLAVVGAVPRRDTHRQTRFAPVLALELPRVRHANVGVAQALVLLQIQRGADRFTAPRDIRRRSATDDLRPAEPFRHHALRTDVSDADREVETLLDQVDDAIGKIEVEQQVRVERTEIRKCRRQVPHPEADAARQAQRAFGFRCRRTHRGFGIFEVRQQLHAVFVERLPGFSQRQSSRSAIEQPNVQV